ncbi:hypothetical protein AOLI_G00275960 [Acnodon oligacanthus]
MASMCASLHMGRPALGKPLLWWGTESIKTLESYPEPSLESLKSSRRTR